MVVELGSLIAVALPAGGAVVWLVRLEGRINLHEAQISEIKEDVRYIRDRIDDALAHRDRKVVEP